MKSQARVWLESAGDDLTVVAEIIHRDELTHMVAFHCQQAIEKSFKAVLEEHEQTPPRTHDLIMLHSHTQDYARLDVELDLLIQLNELYTDSRYPVESGLLPAGKPPIEIAQRMYRLARNIRETVKQHLR